MLFGIFLNLDLYILSYGISTWLLESIVVRFCQTLRVNLIKNELHSKNYFSYGASFYHD